MVKRTKLSLDFKMDVIKRFEENPSTTKKALADHFKIPMSTLNGILKKKEAILAAQIECGSQSSKRSRIQGGKFQELEIALLEWMKEARASNIPVTVDVLRKTAVHLSKTLNIEKFSASHGWVEKFKIRHSLEVPSIHGEKISINKKIVLEWKKDLSSLIKDYKPQDIFNCRETGLFFKMMPKEMSAFKGEPCRDGRNSKERLTVLLCCNADGTEKHPPLIIGKPKNPCCFKNIKWLPCEYFSNCASWMTSKIFINFLYKFERKMEREKRNVILFMDQCPSHPQDLPYFARITVIFFPTNCTSKLQPLNLGLIHSLKVHYRKALVRRFLAELETGNSLAAEIKISILDAMNMVCAAWRSISECSIKKCFKKAGFLFSGEYENNVQINANEEHFNIDLSEDEWKAVSDGLVRFTDFVGVDDNLVTTELRDVRDIKKEMADEDEDDGNEEDVNEEDEEKVPPNHMKALEALETIREYLQFNSVSDAPFSHLDEIEKSVFENQQKQRQSIMDFFKGKQTVNRLPFMDCVSPEKMM